MREEMLQRIDDALAAPRLPRMKSHATPRRAPVEPHPIEDPLPERVELREHQVGWIELFLAIQFLWGAALFIPGAQAFRTVVRVAPFASSLALLAYFTIASLGHRHARMPRASGLLTAALLLLVANLLHPTSQVAAGIAQCVLQASIAAPMFWAHSAVRSRRRLDRVLVLLFLFNLASALLGILQVYYPDQFNPPNFSAALTEEYLNSLSYMSNDGRVIFRPPGLSDQPGGAALAGGLTVLLGMSLAMNTVGVFRRVGLTAAVAIGLAVIYLAQVRSVLLMAIGGGVLLAVLLIRQGRAAAGTWILAAGGALVVVAFLWAAAVGGTAIEERFTNLRQTGVLQSYQENRGHYISNTLGEMLDKYPLGAGLGRWGMTNTYFGDGSEPIYVEPQITGWLLDGGIPMWALYGGAVLASLLWVVRVSGNVASPTAHAATMIAPVLAFILGLGMAGPIFNTQMGILFWTLASALHGASEGENAELTSRARSSRSSEAAAIRAARA